MLKTVGFPSTRTGDQTIVAGNLVIGTAAKGVNFTANTPAAGMTNQLLDWYEEGTWTPAFAFGGGSTGLTYAAQVGRYTRVGRLVTVTAYVNISNKGSSAGDMTISGLPFANANVTNNYIRAVICTTAGAGVAGGTYLQIAPNATSGTVFLNAGVQTAVTNVTVNTAFDVSFTFTYFV